MKIKTEEEHVFITELIRTTRVCTILKHVFNYLSLTIFILGEPITDLLCDLRTSLICNEPSLHNNIGN